MTPLQPGDARGDNRSSDLEHVLLQGSVPGKESESPGLTVAAALCSSAVGAGGGSRAAGAEPGAAAPGARDRVVLPVSWDPVRSRGHLAQPQTHSPARQEEGDSVKRCQGICPLQKGLLTPTAGHRSLQEAHPAAQWALLTLLQER